MRILFLAIILIFLMFMLCQCMYEKDIQVELHKWTLVKKDAAVRWPTDHWRQDFIWMVWKDDRGISFRERMREEDANNFPIGITIYNRDRR